MELMLLLAPLIALYQSHYNILQSKINYNKLIRIFLVLILIFSSNMKQIFQNMLSQRKRFNNKIKGKIFYPQIVDNHIIFIQLDDLMP